MKNIKIFVSYAHINLEWVSVEGKYKLIPWLDKQLGLTVDIWTDHVLKEHLGEKYTNLIKEQILNADLALLLLSQDFVSSKYITEIELPLIKQKYNEGKIQILPLLITNLSNKGKEKISWIFNLQIYPINSKSLINFVNSDLEWEIIKLDILNEIENKINLIKELRSISTINPTNLVSFLSAKEYFDLGVKFQQEGNYDKAIEHYQESINLDPNNAEVYYNLGLSFKNNGEYDKAISSYLKATSINPNYANAFFYAGVLFQNKREYDNAISAYLKVVTIEPFSADAYYNMGISYHEKGEYDEAISAYLKAISIDPNDADIYNNIGILFQNLNKFDKSIPFFLKAISIDPNHANVYNNLGISYINNSESEKAISSFLTATSINPNYANAYHNIGDYYLKKNDRKKMIEYYKKAAKLGSKECQEWLIEKKENW